jgi:hypothetical protein
MELVRSPAVGISSPILSTVRVYAEQRFRLAYSGCAAGGGGILPDSRSAGSTRMP